MIKFLDLLRIALVAGAFFFGYMTGFKESYDPLAQLHFMIPVIIIAISGISGFEGLFFGKQSAGLKGFETGSNYQRQSAFAMISFAIMSAIIYFIDWGIIAELTLFFTFILFFTLSGINHAVDAIRNNNYKWQNINRPFLVLLLIAGSVYPVVMALRSLN